MLPLRDGLAVCREIRQTGSAVPILMLTAMDHVEARVAGLDAGADDYLTKPFDFRELLARLRALSRRGSQAPAPEQFSVGDLDFNVRARRVAVHGIVLALTTREYALLEYLARRPDTVAGRADIAEHVWDDRYDPFRTSSTSTCSACAASWARPAPPRRFARARGEGYQLVPTTVDSR